MEDGIIIGVCVCIALLICGGMVVGLFYYKKRQNKLKNIAKSYINY